MVEKITFDNFSEQIAEGKVVIDFWAPWCAPCHMMASVLEALSDRYGDVNFFKVNVDEEGVLAGAFGIGSIPYCVYFVDGRIMSHASGYMNQDELAKALGLG